MSARMDRLEFYRETSPVNFGDTRLKLDWRWRYVAANGNILAVSSEGYRRRIDAVKAAARVLGVYASTLATCCVPAAAEGVPHPASRWDGEKLRVVVKP